MRKIKVLFIQEKLPGYRTDLLNLLNSNNGIELEVISSGDGIDEGFEMPEENKINFV